MTSKNNKDPFEKLKDPQELPEDEIEWVSKTQIKKDMLELTAMGKTIVEMGAADTKKIPLDEELLSAIKAARGMRMGALKRQIQFIGKLLRQRDTNDIEQAVNAILTAKDSSGRAFKQLEKWRDRLLEEGNDALTEFCNTYPSANVQKLRQLIRNTQKERSQGKPPKYYRELFQEIKAISNNA